MKKRWVTGLAIGLCFLSLNLWGCAAPGRNAVLDPGSGEETEPAYADLSGRKTYTWGGNLYLPPKEEGAYTLEEVLFEMLAQTDTGSNLLISPYSLRCVLTSLYHTAEEGEAKKELALFLGYEGSEGTVYEEQRALREEILRERTGIELSLADSFWVLEELAGEAAAEQAEVLRESYGCELFSVKDFEAGTVRQMNEWVEKATRGMIREIFSSLDPETMLVLLSALYFDGTWQTVFEPKDTLERTFYGCAAGEEGNTVPFMFLEKEDFLLGNCETSSRS